MDEEAGQEDSEGNKEERIDRRGNSGWNNSEQWNGQWRQNQGWRWKSMPGFDGWKNLTDCGTRYDRRTPQAKAKRKQKAELKLKAKQNEDENKEEKQEKEDADSGLPGENDNPAASTAKNQKKRQQRETVEASTQTVESYPPQLLVANATAETEPCAKCSHPHGCSRG